MSSYWSAYYGAALVLNENEFDDFLNRYVKRKNIKREEFDAGLEDTVIDEFQWLRSDAKVEDTTIFEENANDYNKCFEITFICKDTCDGMYLIPFRYKGRPNTTEYQERVHAFSTRDDNLYVIFSDKDLCSPTCFEEKPYPSYEAFVQEFKDKMEKYLPEDFDWDEHLGNFSYAAYA